MDLCVKFVGVDGNIFHSRYSSSIKDTARAISKSEELILLKHIEHVELLHPKVGGMYFHAKN